VAGSSRILYMPLKRRFLPIGHGYERLARESQQPSALTMPSSCTDMDVRPSIRQSASPNIVLQHTEDVIFPPDEARTFADRIPGALYS